jgi:anti-sigma B factor antagonist
VEFWRHEAPSGTIEMEHEPDGPVLHLRGDVDATVVQRWEAEGPVDRSAFVAIDVSKMAYIDSTGLSLLVRWAQEQSAAGRPAVLRNPTPRCKQVLYVAGITELFVLKS